MAGAFLLEHIFSSHLSQMSMYVLRLGIIATLLSETLVSGFTTGAAVHVFTSQVKDLLGVSLAPKLGNFKLVLVSGCACRSVCYS